MDCSVLTSHCTTSNLRYWYYYFS